MINSTMEIMYIEAQKKPDFLDFNKSALNKLPKTLLIAYSIQYKLFAQEVYNYLKSQSYNIVGLKQVLGCTKLISREKQVPVLLIGSGKFHALNIAVQTDKPLFLLCNGKIEELSSKDRQKLRTRRQGALMRFLAADRIGIIVSTKLGQNRIADAKRLSNQLKAKGKSAYIFVADSINSHEFENFSIDSWVNTACSGLALDSPQIINIDELSTVK